MLALELKAREFGRLIGYHTTQINSPANVRSLSEQTAKPAVRWRPVLAESGRRLTRLVFSPPPVLQVPLVDSATATELDQCFEVPM
jgi:hypothetical protein